ncbi:hypothetical protein HZB96_02405 [Candidatus Gottesmanbacteria bacterium]|nr:hypothetical protein [Candidatus Gottesmanbacteria bacterium]
MSEQLKNLPTSEIKWPPLGKVEVGNDVDFVYIMRKDGDFTMNPIALRMSEEYLLDEQKTKLTVLEEYDTFFSKLADTFRWAFVHKGNFELHLYDPNQLAEEVRNKAGNTPIVSLDPLMNKGVIEHKVSRGFYLSGKKDFAQVPRPGSPPIHIQAQQISRELNNIPIVVAEDDIFSGGGVIVSLSELLKQKLEVKETIPGIQIGKPKKLVEMGIHVNAVVVYEATQGNILDKVDLGDPRDYLIGASGLVIKMPNGEYARAPYIPPFVSTAARASIPPQSETKFALKVLQANLDFLTV